MIDSFYKNNLDKILNIEPLEELILNQTETQKNSRCFRSCIELNKKISPIIPDLSRLYNLVRNNKPFTVLEFGIGYSTIIIAQIVENKKQFNNIHKKN